MIKIEGYAGLKFDWLLDKLCKDLNVDKPLAVRVLVDVIFDSLTYNCVLDCCAERLQEISREDNT